MKQRAFFAAAGALLLMGVTVGAGQARAQMSPDMIMENYNSNINAIVSSRINAHVLDQAIRRNGGGRGSRRGTSVRSGVRGSAASAVRRVATTYTPTPQITTALRDDLVAKVRTRDPKNGELLAKTLQQYNFVTLWRNLVAPYGLKTNDVADALTAYLVLGWVEANHKEDVTPAQMRGVREQVKTAFGTTPAFARLSNANRQQLAEALMLQFVLQHGAAQKAQKDGNAALSQRLADAFHSQIRGTFGVNLRAMTVTNTGFRAKG